MLVGAPIDDVGDVGEPSLRRARESVINIRVPSMDGAFAALKVAPFTAFVQFVLRRIH